MKQEFIIRTYRFGELAQLYLPNIHPRSASLRLKAWINHNKKLSKGMEERGFVQGMRMLTPEMVREIVRVVGEP